jgi:transcription antitermination protein NusB
LRNVQGRREARERALELLYEAETKQTTCSAIVDALPVSPDPYATALATGVDADLAAIDTLISDHATGWTLERMPAVDRAVLRMATFELLHRPDVPVAVAISEAVELAQQFSTEESGRYVNGLLGAVAKQTRPDG